MPTLSRSAVPIDQDFFGPIEIDNQLVENIRASWYPYTMPFNLTGNPAVSLPCGFDAAGMPLAIQLVARPGADAELLRVAAAFEGASRGRSVAASITLYTAVIAGVQRRSGSWSWRMVPTGREISSIAALLAMQHPCQRPRTPAPIPSAAPSHSTATPPAAGTARA